MTTTEIKNKGEKTLWSEGKFSGINEKPFFRIDILSREDSEKYYFGKPFMIMIQGGNFNKEIHEMITKKQFGEYSVKINTDLKDFEWYSPELYKSSLNTDGFVDLKLVPPIYKTYIYSVSNIDCILEKIVEVETIVGKNIVSALEVIL